MPLHLLRSGLALVVLAIVGCGPSKQEIAAVEATLADAEKTAPEHVRKFEAATAGRESVTPGAGACPLVPKTTPPRPGSPEEKLAGQLAQVEAAHGAGVLGFTAVVRAGKPIESPHALRLRSRAAELRKALHEARGAMTEDITSIKRRADELASPSFWSWDLVVDVEREATVGAVDVTKKTFQKGAAAGRAYAYDHAKGAIVCVGEFEATSSDRVEFGAQRGQEGAMGRFAAGVDLDAQSIRAARESLREVRR